MVRHHALRSLAIVLSLWLAGCTTPGYVIQKPPSTLTCSDPAGASCNVPVEVAWKGVSVNPYPDLQLDGVAPTSPPTWATAANSVTTTLTTAAGNHTLNVYGLLSDGGSIKTYSTSSAFTVTLPQIVALAVSPTGTLQVPRTGAQAITLDLTRTNSTQSIQVSAAGLPSGVQMASVTLPGTSSSPASLPASLTASDTANGSKTATFTAQMSGAVDATVSRLVQVVPKAGAFTWVAAPFLTATGPPPATSPDGRFAVTASRMGASRVWTLRIAPTGTTGSPLNVTTASWGGAGGSNLAGIAFCPFSRTLTALVLSDDDESDPPTGHAAGVTYRLKVIRLDGATPQEIGSLEGLKFLSGVQPRLGFSQDCTLVASWSIEPTLSTQRFVQFLDMFNNQTGGWSFTDSASSPSASLATISGSSITISAPQNQTTTIPVP